MMIPTALALTTCLSSVFGAPEPRLVWALPAGAAVVADETIVFWAPDFRSVLAVDALGRRLWRVATGDQGGYRDLERLGPNVLAYAGEEAILIAPKTGKVLGRQPHVRLASPGQPGCRIESHAGACAVVCPCGFLPVRCDDLGAAAPRASIPTFEEWDTDGNRTSQCMGRAGQLIGLAGDTEVVELPSPDLGNGGAKDFALTTDLVGFDVHTAKERWRSHALVDGLSSFDVELSGALPDGKTCWLGSRSGSLRVFDCQRATLLWSRQLAVPPGVEPQIEAAGQGLVVRDGPKAKRFSASGETVWEVDVPKTDLVLLSDDTAFRYRRIAKLTGATVLDPATGARRAHIALPAGLTRWPIPFAGGWLTLADREVSVTSAQGVTSSPVKAVDFIEDVAAGPTLIALRTRDAISVRGQADARSAAVDGDVIIAVEGAAGPNRVLVLKDGEGPWDPKNPKTFGELRLYDLALH
ncbi:MAG: PQQ-binding-like beta-propeller repeat protein [Myxococcota bacterium]